MSKSVKIFKWYGDATIHCILNKIPYKGEELHDKPKGYVMRLKNGKLLKK